MTVYERPSSDVASTLAIGLFLLVTLAGLSGAGGGIFPPLYVATAVLAGLIAYHRAPVRYVSFVYFLWFFSPFVRRVFDLSHGFNPTNLVLLAPVLVTLTSALTLVYRVRELRGAMLYPFIFTMAGIGYGYAVGILKAGMIPATYSMLTWVGPVSFAMHLNLNWRIFPVLRDSFLTFLQFAIPVIAAYGIYQVAFPPVWDTYWMDAAQVYSIGFPVPFGFRAFGTLNTPGPFAVALLIGILFLIGTNRRGLVISLALALIALLLTRTRSAWVALVVGLFVVQFLGPIRRMMRNWLLMLLMLVLAIPLLSLDSFRDSIAKRLTSFSTIAKDNSVKTRLIMAGAATKAIAARAEGMGLGATGGAAKLQEGTGAQASIDNGFLEIFFVLGWPGGAMLFVGLIGQLVTLMRFRDAREDAFANSARACFWAMMSVLLIGDIFSGAVGAMFWGSYGFACSAHAYNYAMGRGLRSRQLASELVVRPMAAVVG